MVVGMSPYRCVKCGHYQRRTAYRPAGYQYHEQLPYNSTQWLDLNSRTSKECLEFTCENCGYMWLGFTKDTRND